MNTPTSKTNTHPINYLKIAAAVIIAIAILHHALSICAFNFFFFLDNLLAVSLSLNPVIAWAVLGLFIGGVIGMTVAVSKLKLDKKMIAAPIGILVFLLAILFVITKPLNISNSPTSPVAISILPSEYNIATSSYWIYKSTQFLPIYLGDNDTTTAWVPQTQSGVNELIYFTIPSSLNQDNLKYYFTGFKVYNGYGISKQLWVVNNRVREFKIIKNSDAPVIGSLKDEMGYQMISTQNMEVKAGDKITFQIDNIYNTYNANARTVVSELVPIIEARTF